MSSRFDHLDDPSWTPVIGASRETGGIRCRFTTVQSGEFSYLVPWAAVVNINGRPISDYEERQELVELVVGKYARLSFNDLGTVLVADFEGDAIIPPPQPKPQPKPTPLDVYPIPAPGPVPHPQPTPTPPVGTEPVESELAAMLVSHTSGSVLSWTGKPWAVEANAWGAAGYRHDLRTYLNQYDSGPVAGWAWDFPVASGQVMAYPELIVGKKPWAGNTTDPRFPIKVSNAFNLAVTYEIRNKGKGEYNSAFEVWLTDSLKADEASIRNEVMFWVGHRGWRSPAGMRIRDLQDSELWLSNPIAGRAWSIFSYLFHEPYNKGTIRIGERLKSLVSLGLLDGNQYIASLEFGNEVWNGSGVTVIDTYEIHL